MASEVSLQIYGPACGICTEMAEIYDSVCAKEGAEQAVAAAFRNRAPEADTCFKAGNKKGSGLSRCLKKMFLRGCNSLSEEVWAAIRIYPFTFASTFSGSTSKPIL